MAGEWDGRPENPERDGWHWMRSRVTRHVTCRPWHAKARSWETLEGELMPPHHAAALYDYLGPCLTPDEHRSALAAAHRRGQEQMRTRAAAACLRRAHASAEDDLTPIEEAVRDEAIYCARAIRALEIEG